MIWKGEKRRQKGTDEKIKARVDNFTDALKVTAADAQREQAAVTDQIQALGRSLQSIERDLETAKQERESASERLIAASHSNSRRNLELLTDKKLDLVSSVASPLQSLQLLKVTENYPQDPYGISPGAGMPPTSYFQSKHFLH